MRLFGRGKNPPGEDEPNWDEIQESLARPDDVEAVEDAVVPVKYTPPEERFPPLPTPEAQKRRRPRSPQRKRRQGNWRHDVVAVFFLIATVALARYYLLIYEDRYTPLNPFAPPTPFIEVSITPDAAAVATYFVTLTAEAAGGSVPTASPTTAVTAAPVEPETLYPFAVSESGVTYATNTNERGCNWSSIAGTVRGLEGEALDNYSIQIIDAEDPDRLTVRVFSGAALAMGPGGYEFNLGGTPTEGQYTVQLYSPAGVPLSEEIMIFTRNTCAENVAKVDFIQIRPS